jgi:mannose-6-phosphate isomerase-like protein (cupin superfamily)
VIDRKDAMQWNGMPNMMLREAKSCKYKYVALSKTKLSKNMLPYILEYESNANESSKHDGEEFVYVLEGTLEILYGSDRYVLEAGDSAYFECYIPHVVKSKGHQKAKILNVIFPYTKTEPQSGI